MLTSIDIFDAGSMPRTVGSEEGRAIVEAESRNTSKRAFRTVSKVADESQPSEIAISSSINRFIDLLRSERKRFVPKSGVMIDALK